MVDLKSVLLGLLIGICFGLSACNICHSCCESCTPAACTPCSCSPAELTDLKTRVEKLERTKTGADAGATP